MIPDLTARTGLGAVDLVPFLRRDAGHLGVQMRDWERAPAAIALARLGWGPERIGHAVGLSSGRVRELLNGEDQAKAKLLRQSRAQASRNAASRRSHAKRLAGRVEVDGRLIHPHAPRHGANVIYQAWGCRCMPCTRAHAESNAQTRRNAS